MTVYKYSALVSRVNEHYDTVDITGEENSNDNEMDSEVPFLCPKNTSSGIAGHSKRQHPENEAA